MKNTLYKVILITLLGLSITACGDSEPQTQNNVPIEPVKPVVSVSKFLYAADNGNFAKIQKMISDAGDDLPNLINTQNSDGETAILLATQGSYKMIVQELINANANLDIQDEDGWTALMYASRSGYYEVVKVLLDAGADFELQNQSRKTAAILAVGGNVKYMRIVKLIHFAEFKKLQAELGEK